MTRSLRRSRRGTQKKNSEYNVGDVVEISRGNIILHGRLAQLLTEGTSPNPRWLIKFDGQAHKDEEVYERSFGRIISTTDDDLNAVGEVNYVPAQRRNSKTGISNPPAHIAKRGSSGGKASGTSSEGEITEEPKVASSKISKPGPKKGVSFNDGSNAGSDYSSNTEMGVDAKVSAREQRSRRRQAKIDEETVPPQPEIGQAVHKRRPPPPNRSKAKRQRTDDDGEVVKVKLLTGTLYLYRGVHRRVEFLRRV